MEAQKVQPMSWALTAALTIASLIAFAGNSLLCRLALLPGENGTPAIGPWAFTAIRLLAGAAALTLLLLIRRSGSSVWASASSREPGWWRAPVALAAYAVTFSYSYVTLPAGIGALILFGTVQVVMVVAAKLRGEPIGPPQILGMAIAIAGIVLLVRPWQGGGASDVDPMGAIAMAIAGVGWAAYTLAGRGAVDAIAATGRNFLLCAPAAAIALCVLGVLGFAGEPSWTGRGVLLSVTAGAVTSGAGYVVWYTALRGHSRTSAAVVQLTVPVLAMVGGIAWLGESFGARLAVAAAMVLGGVALALVTVRSR